MTKKFTVAEAAEVFGVKSHTILAWIEAGDLAAVDVSRQRKTEQLASVGANVDDDDIPF